MVDKAQFTEAFTNFLNHLSLKYSDDKEIRETVRQFRFIVKTNPRYVRTQIKMLLIDPFREHIVNNNYDGMHEHFLTMDRSYFGDNYTSLSNIIAKHSSNLTVDDKNAIMSLMRNMNDSLK